MGEEGKAEVVGTGTPPSGTLSSPSLAFSNPLFSGLSQDTGFPSCCPRLNDCPEGGYKEPGWRREQKNRAQQIWAPRELQAGAVKRLGSEAL